MSVWTDNETQQVQIVQVDPLSAILNAIGDVKEIVIDVRDRDLAYLRTRVDAQWVSIGDLQKTKADRTEMAEMEKRVNSKAFDLFDKATDDVTRVRSLAETSDASFDSLQDRLTEIEKETARIQPMAETLTTLSKQVGRLNRLSWQMAGGAAATGALMFTLGFLLRMFWHMQWFEELFHIHP